MVADRACLSGRIRYLLFIARFNYDYTFTLWARKKRDSWCFIITFANMNRFITFSPSDSRKNMLYITIMTLASPWMCCYTALWRMKIQNCYWFRPHTTLFVPATRRSSLGDRAFSVAAARSWNTLPVSLRTVLSYLTFRRELKTFLFNISFPDSWTVCVTL